MAARHPIDEQLPPLYSLAALCTGLRLTPRKTWTRHIADVAWALRETAFIGHTNPSAHRMNKVRVHATNDAAGFGPSDHCRIQIEVE